MSVSIRVALSCCIALCAAEARTGAAARPMPAPPSVADDGSNEARALFTEGLDFVEHEDWVQAEDCFRRVLALHSSHVAAYNLGSALVHLSRLVEAAEVLRSILRANDVDSPDARRGAATPAPDRAAHRLADDPDQRRHDRGALHARRQAARAHRAGADDLDRFRRARRARPAGRRSAGRGPRRRGRRCAAAGRAGAGAARTDCARARRPRGGIEPSAAAARARTAPPPPMDEDEASSGVPWWVWAAGSVAVAAAGAVTVVLVASGGEASPVTGDTSPGVVRGRVR